MDTLRPQKILVALGTRPEAIKLASTIQTLARDGFAVETFFSMQHADLARPVLDFFNLDMRHRGEPPRAGCSLPDLTPHIMSAFNRVLDRGRPDLVLVQGDTATAAACALSAFYARVPVGHVEAGLRTFRLDEPFPEEANRQIIARVARFHFTPTEAGRLNLIRDGVSGGIFVTGNTGMDALRLACERLEQNPNAADCVAPHSPILTMTIHRRENFGPRIEAIFRTVKDWAAKQPDLTVVVPAHPNPEAMRPAQEILSGCPNVRLIDALDYPEMVALLRKTALLVTDSGGLQEEANALGIPTIVARDQTERTEIVTSPLVRLSGADPDRLKSALEHFGAPTTRLRRFDPANVYGDGHAAERISAILRALPPRPVLQKPLHEAVT